MIKLTKIEAGWYESEMGDVIQNWLKSHCIPRESDGPISGKLILSAGWHLWLKEDKDTDVRIFKRFKDAREALEKCRNLKK